MGEPNQEVREDEPVRQIFAFFWVWGFGSPNTIPWVLGSFVREPPEGFARFQFYYLHKKMLI